MPKSHPAGIVLTASTQGTLCLRKMPRFKNVLDEWQQLFLRLYTLILCSVIAPVTASFDGAMHAEPYVMNHGD